MHTNLQKKVGEKFYAEKAAELLRESWAVEFPEDEINWPDLIVTTASENFGLEVRRIFSDEKKTGGSPKKEDEQNRQEKVKKLADDFYAKSNFTIKVDFLGNIDQDDKLLNAIIDVAQRLLEFEQERIEAYDNCVVYVTKLPDQFGQYKRWTYVSDKVGWVRNIDANFIEKFIIEKAKKLPKYAAKITDVRLLLVSNRINNSGKCRLENNIVCNTYGFKEVYYLSYPVEAWKLGKK